VVRGRALPPADAVTVAAPAAPPASLARALDDLPNVSATDAAEVVERYASDYGGVVRRRPAVVAQARDAAGVAAVLRLAGRHGVPVVTSGAAHTQGGQALGTDAIVLDTRRLAGVEHVDPPTSERTGSFVAGAGTRWIDVLTTTMTQGAVPPVLTTHLGTTIGGTHSVGGVGHTSVVHGAQVDNCVALELVTAAGDVAWVSEHEQPSLFAHALAGLGRLGVITRVRHALVRPPDQVRVALYSYRDRHVLLDDVAALLAADGRRRHALHAVHSWSVHAHRGWLHLLSVTQPAAPGASPPSLGMLRGRPVQDRVAAFAAHVLEGREATSRDWRLGSGAPTVRPGVDVFATPEVSHDLGDTILTRLPDAIRGTTAVLTLFLDGARSGRPLLACPGAPEVHLLSVLPDAPVDTRVAVLDAVRHIAGAAASLGARRYLPGWHELDDAGWRAQIGGALPELARLKQAVDPAGILNPQLPVPGGVTRDS